MQLSFEQFGKIGHDVAWDFQERFTRVINQGVYARFAPCDRHTLLVNYQNMLSSVVANQFAHWCGPQLGKSGRCCQPYPELFPGSVSGTVSTIA